MPVGASPYDQFYNRHLLKQLSSNTSVPTDFIAIYDELVSDCRFVERILHAKFQSFRVNPKREFFEIPPKEAIKALQETANNFVIASSKFSYSRSFVDNLRNKFGKYIRSDIESVNIVQTNETCFLEILRRPYIHSKDQIAQRTDLDFITDDEEPMFSPFVSPDENAAIFVDKMDIASVLNCVSEIIDDDLAKSFNGMSYEENRRPNSKYEIFLGV